MTTTDARKRNRDMRDAHETARERDARAKADARHARFMAAIDRILARDPQTAGDSTPPSQETDTMTEPQTKTEWLADIAVESHRTNELLAEIRDRMPEREARVAPFDPDVIAANLEAIKHEAETPMRGHGECCEPAPVPRPEPACVCGSVDDFHLPACYEPAAITEEPPVGSQLTDREGDVWERRTGWRLSWHVWLKEMRTWDTEPEPWELADYRCVTDYAPLRPTTDEDRVRVGLPVDPAPADVDPDEALAKVLEAADQRTATWLGMAREVRKHIDRNSPPEVTPLLERECEQQRVRVVKAEADLARATKERDGMEAARNAALQNEANTYDRMVEWQERALKAEAKADRYDALRVDDALAKAICESLDFPPSSLLGEAVAAAVADILTRDTKRAES